MMKLAWTNAISVEDRNDLEKTINDWLFENTHLDSEEAEEAGSEIAALVAHKFSEITGVAFVVQLHEGEKPSE